MGYETLKVRTETLKYFQSYIKKTVTKIFVVAFFVVGWPEIC